MTILSDTDSVIDALGGTHAVAQLFDCRMQRISNWRGEEYFPPDTFETLWMAMSEKGIGLPLSLWRQIPTEQLERMKFAPAASSRRRHRAARIGLQAEAGVATSCAKDATGTGAASPSQRRNRRRKAA